MAEDNFKEIIRNVGLEMFENEILEDLALNKERIHWLDEKTILYYLISEYQTIQRFILKSLNNFSDRIRRDNIFYTSKEEIIENLNKQQKEKWKKGEL